MRLAQQLLRGHSELKVRLLECSMCFQIEAETKLEW